jgi:anti-sigma-K factor RskA
MNYERPAERLAMLADEYVVGTLTGRARRRFERALATSAQARVVTRSAEDRLLALDERLPVAQPSPATWRAIEQRLFDTASTVPARARAAWSSWRLALAIALVGFAIGIGWLVYRSEVPAGVDVARVQTTEGAALWTLTTDRARSRLTVRASGAVRARADHDYELWALPAGAGPVSLGLLPVSGRSERVLNEAQRAALGRSPKVAVSLEPAGGSPTGAPTGPVLYVADVQLARS